MKNINDINTNISQTGNHYFKIDRFEDVSYNIQECELPSVTLGKIDMPTPFGVNISVLGDSIEFSEFDVTFIVDEDFNNYKHLFNWMVSAKQSFKLNSQSDYMKTAEKFMRDNNWYAQCELYLLTNKKNFNQTIRFRECFPTSLSALSFTVR